MRSATVVYPGEVRNPAGCEIYRGNMPMHYLAVKGKWRTDFTFFRLLFEDYRKNSRILQDYFSQFETVVLPRMYLPDDIPDKVVSQVFDLIRSCGCSVVYEVDDDYTNVYRHTIEGTMIPVAQGCDAITVTTPYLQAIMEAATGRKAYVLPNMLSPDVWKGKRIDRPLPADHILICLSGSASHKGDWIVLKDVLPRILERHQHVHLAIGGYHPEYLQDLPRTVYVPALDYGRYADMIRQSDIILAPVDTSDGFNLGKSPIKAIEGMGAQRLLPDGRYGGAAVVASDNPVYRLVIKDGENGFLSPFIPEAWEDMIERLIQDSTLRQRFQRKGFQHVWKHYDISTGWKLWADAYTDIRNQFANHRPMEV
jgi:glycosyltransferase involved in cell wall biosynthesis